MVSDHNRFLQFDAVNFLMPVVVFRVSSKLIPNTPSIVNEHTRTV